MAQKKNNDPLGDVLAAAFKLLLQAASAAFLGIKRLNKPPAAIGLLAALAAAVGGFLAKNRIISLESLFGQALPLPLRYVLYGLILLMPLFYLIILGSGQKRAAESYYSIFSEIGFIGRDKKYPFLVNETTENKVTTYTFKSNIPVSEWKKAKDRLETGLDCSIRRIDQGKNKKLVELVTVSSDFKIPENIPWKDEYITQRDGEMVIGESDLDRLSFNLNKTPHVLVAGETGSGKSVTLRCILWQMISKGARVFMIDFKGGVEFGKAYERYGEVITDRKRALTVLQMLVAENQERLKLFRDLEVKNLKEYNDKTGENLCRIGVFVDEIAEMLDKKGVAKQDKEIYEQLEGALSTLARLSRATGINLIFGVQRPDANILTGQIKNNIPVRICGRFVDGPASEIVLGNTAACNLPEIQGRMIYRMGNKQMEFQGYFFNDEKDLRPANAHPGGMLIDQPIYDQPDESPLPSAAAPAKGKVISLDLKFDD